MEVERDLSLKSSMLEEVGRSRPPACRQPAVLPTWSGAPGVLDGDAALLCWRQVKAEAARAQQQLLEARQAAQEDVEESKGRAEAALAEAAERARAQVRPLLRIESPLLPFLARMKRGCRISQCCSPCCQCLPPLALQLTEAQVAAEAAQVAGEAAQREAEALRRQLAESEEELGLIRASADRAAAQAARRAEELEERNSVRQRSFSRPPLSPSH